MKTTKFRDRVNLLRLGVYLRAQRVLVRLGVNLPPPLFYIGGSDTLPPPLD